MCRNLHFYMSLLTFSVILLSKPAFLYDFIDFFSPPGLLGGSPGLFWGRRPLLRNKKSNETLSKSNIRDQKTNKT